MTNLPYRSLRSRYGAACLVGVIRSAPARSLLTEAAAWTVYALRYARMDQQATPKKAFEALLFSIKHNVCGQLRGFAVPSKLVGVSAFQNRLQALRKDGPPLLELAATRAEGGQSRVVALLDNEAIGFVQEKHDWLVPLAQKGVSARILQVTGDGPEAGRYHGYNVAFTGLASAIRKL